MDDLTNKEVAQPETASLQEQVNALKQLVTSLLILMIVGGGTFTFFMYRQFYYSRVDATALRQIVDEYNTTHLPAIQEFRTRLQEYARTHSDFAPLAAKYGLVTVPAPASPTSAPSAAAPPAKKK